MNHFLRTALIAAAASLLAACGNSQLPSGAGSKASTLSVAPTQMQEGSDQALVFTVLLSPASSKTVSVRFATQDGSAKAGTDYSSAAGELSFAPGETSKTVRVPLLGNDCHDLERSLSLVLSEPREAVVQTTSALGAILDDDAGGPSYKAGAAKRVVSPTAEMIAGLPHEFCPTTTQFFYQGGFGIRDVDVAPCTPLVVPIKTPAEGVGRDIHIRLLLLTQGEQKIAFVTLDAIGIGNVIQEGVKRRINAVTGVAKENILFGATHTHQSGDLQGLWGGVPFEWRQLLYTQAEAAATEAMANLADVEVAYAQQDLTEPTFNNYRRTDDTIGTDKRMTVLQARNSVTGLVTGTLVQYVAHPTVLGAGNKLIHGDWVGAFNDRLEAVYPGSTAVYFNGDIADASPNTGAADPQPPEGSDDFVRADAFGTTLANRALQIVDDGLKRFAPQTGPQIVADSRVASVPVTNHLFLALAAKGYFNGYYDFLLPPDPDAKATVAPQVMNVANVLVSRVSLGKVGCTALEIATIPGEGSSILGRYIRSLSPTDMMLFGLTQESLGYMLDESQYTTENGTGLVTEPDPLFPLGYEEGVSMGPLTVPTLREQAYGPLFGVAGTVPAP
ncbi:MAG: Calx-beta domain-containing protein [Pseudomonadota bacterium]